MDRRALEEHVVCNGLKEKGGNVRGRDQTPQERDTFDTPHENGKALYGLQVFTCDKKNQKVDGETQETFVQITGLNLMVDPVLSEISERSKINGERGEGSRVTFSVTAESNK